MFMIVKIGEWIVKQKLKKWLAVEMHEMTSYLKVDNDVVTNWVKKMMIYEKWSNHG